MSLRLATVTTTIAMLLGCNSDTGGLIIGDDPTPNLDKDEFQAVCSVGPTPIRPIHESTTWFGDQTPDPKTSPVADYQWTLVTKPTGSAAELPEKPPRKPNVEGFTPDLAGLYVAKLVAIDDFGNESEPCFAELIADPVESLWVELYWDTPKDDMDLHLVRNVDGEFGDMIDDCHHSNCNTRQGMLLKWGAPRLAEDDPRLDLDDINRLGPENINLDTPAEDYYTVWVHDWGGSVMREANEVTVNVYMDGDLYLSESREITGEGKKVPIAEIIWSDRHANVLE